MQNERIILSKEEYKRPLEKARKFDEMQGSEELDLDLIKQFEEGLEDLKTGQIERVG